MPSTLEEWSWASQIAATIVAIIATGAAFYAVKAALSQTSSSKLFEYLKFTNDESFRVARRTVIQRIGLDAKGRWWEDKDFEVAASTVCASYDILGRLIIFNGKHSRTGRFFIENWSDSIIRTFTILEPFIKYRRENGGHDYSGYSWLYASAMKHRVNSGQPWTPMPQTESTGEDPG